MIFITQLIYIRDGQQAIFDQFEEVAIPIIARYHGRMLFRVRPSEQAYIVSAIEKPYEIHLVEFPSEADFRSFMKDEERKNFIHLKEQSISSVILYKGERL